MNQEQKELLKTIVNDKFSVGAFSGMIYNQHIQSGLPIESLVEKALDVRLELTEMSK